MATYYLASPRIRRDPEALAVYVEALPLLRGAIRRLVKGEDGDEVVNRDLRQAWTQFAALHQGIETTAFPRLSPMLDWSKLTTKAEIIKALGSRSSA